jgi:hypothetical protein
MRAARYPCLRAWERSGEVWWCRRNWASATRQTLGFQAARRQAFSIEGGKPGRQNNAIGRWQFDHMLSIPGGGGGGGGQPAVVSDALDVVALPCRILPCPVHSEFENILRRRRTEPKICILIQCRPQVPVSVAPRPPRIVLIRYEKR